MYSKSPFSYFISVLFIPNRAIFVFSVGLTSCSMLPTAFSYGKILNIYYRLLFFFFFSLPLVWIAFNRQMFWYLSGKRFNLEVTTMSEVRETTLLNKIKNQKRVRHCEMQLFLQLLSHCIVFFWFCHTQVFGFCMRCCL